MRRAVLGVILLLLLLPAPAAAQEPTPFRWDAREVIPKRISDVAVGVVVGLDVWTAFRAEDHRERWAFVCRNLITLGVTEVTKRTVHRTRPNRSDRLSFPSGHAGIGAAAASSPLTASLALTVSWGRQAGGMHFGSDVGVGASLGVFSRWVCPKIVGGP